MAVTVIKKGHGQIEPNRCSFLHDGNIESQCVATEAMDNGAIVVVNKVKNETTLATTFTTGLLGVNYTSERIYNQFTPGRKNFYVEEGEYPRIGYLKVGDVFTTNVMLTDASSIGDTEVSAIKEGKLYWTAPTTISSLEAKPEGLALQVVEITDTADGQTALKIQVV